VVELEIPARPEFVGIARMFVSALAGVRPGLAYERVDDLRIVVSEACTGAIEAMTADGDDGDGCRLVLRCSDGPERLEVCIAGPAGAFEATVPGEGDDAEEEFRISLIRALVDDVQVRPLSAGMELCLAMEREAAVDADDEC